jgi:hypothetical protein
MRPLLSTFLAILFNAACIGVPLVAPSLLPLPLAFSVWGFLCLGYWIAWVRQRRHSFDALGELLQGWAIGLGIAAFVASSNPWFGAALGVAVAVCCLAVENRIRAATSWGRPPNPFESDRTGPPRAWHDGQYLQCPTGGVTRCIECKEVRMGGPLSYTYLLPDGTLIDNAGRGAGFSDDGRYFVTTLPFYDGICLHDREEARSYTLAGKRALSCVDYGRTAANRRVKISVSAVKAIVMPEPFIPVADIRVRESMWLEGAGSEAPRDTPSPGQITVGRRLWLPASLADKAEPHDFILQPLAELWIDSRPSGLLVSWKFEPMLHWSSDGESFCCTGIRLDNNASPAALRSRAVRHRWERGAWRVDAPVTVNATLDPAVGPAESRCH